MKIWFRNLTFLFLLQSSFAFATDYTVTLTTDGNSGGGGNSGDLRFALTQLGVTGTAGAAATNNNIFLQVANGSTINVGAAAANWPAITRGVTICYSTNGTTCASSGSGSVTISGATGAAATTPAARLLATQNASLTLNNTALQYGLAQGGNATNGGGGGMGAGGGVFVAPGNTLTLQNSSVSSCLAQGGNGGSGTPTGTGGGSGAPASFGAFTPTGVTTVTYGGGNGGTSFGGGTGGTGSVGTGAGSPGSGTTGGAGGYCGGGGGAGYTGATGPFGGGGGGTTGGAAAGTAGVGGGYGAGGVGSTGGGNTDTGGGGGGGFGGGGGASDGNIGVNTSTGANYRGGNGGGGQFISGGGGGGFGGGAGGSGIGPGTGGAGLGGGVFVADSATLTINDTAGTASNIASNNVSPGSGGAAAGGNGASGNAAAPGVFLFKGAKVQFTGSVDVPVNFTIQGDPNATGTNIDAGVIINTVNNSTNITFNNAGTNFQGPLTITKGTLTSAGANLPGSSIGAPGIISLTSNATANLSGTFPTNTVITNAGTTNITGSFAPANNSTNTNIMNINSGGSFTQPGTYTYTGTININTGTNPLASAITGGAGSVLRIGNSTPVAFTTSNSISSVETISVFSTTGTGFIVNNAITGISSQFAMEAGTLTTLNASVGGTGFTRNDGTLVLNANNVLNTSGALTNNATGAIYIPAVFTPATYSSITNNGSVNLYGPSASLSTAYNNGAATTGSLNFGRDKDGTLYNNTINITSAITNTNNIRVYAGTLANSASGTITGVGTSFTVDANATATFGAAFSGAATVTNNGTVNVNSGITTGTFNNNNILNIASTISTGAQNLVSSGTINVNGQRSLTTNLLDSTGALNFSITDEVTNDKLSITGAADLAGSTLTVSAPNALTGSWEIMTTTGSLTGPSTFILPGGSSSAPLFGWSANVSSNSITINGAGGSFTSLATGTFNIEVAEVLDQMASGTINPGQQALLNAFYASPTEGALNANFHQMFPNINAATTNVVVQNNLFTAVQNRIAIQSEDLPEEVMGISAGSLNANTAVWLGGFGNISKQKAHEINDGYRAKAAGSIFGIDHKCLDGSMFGSAFAISNSNIYELSNVNYTTRILGYHGLIYGANAFKGDFYIDWLFTGSFNQNRGNRSININGINMAVSSYYNNYQAGLNLAGGKVISLSEDFIFAQENLLQYSFIHQPSYSETGSVAALNIYQNENRSILTVGTGFRLGLADDEQFVTGRREVHAFITYDAINGQNVTTANFIVGSNSFTITDNPTRIGIIAGVDYSVLLSDCMHLQFSYNYEWRKNYYANFGEIALKYVF